MSRSGIFLSSGVDSSALATVASEVHRGGIHTSRSASTSPSSTRPRRRPSSHGRSGPSHTVLRLTGPELLEDIEQVFCGDGPADGRRFQHLRRLPCGAPGGLTVALSGLGGTSCSEDTPSFRDVPRAASLRRLIPFSSRSPSRLSAGQPGRRPGNREGARAAGTARLDARGLSAPSRALASGGADGVTQRKLAATGLTERFLRTCRVSPTRTRSPRSSSAATCGTCSFATEMCSAWQSDSSFGLPLLDHVFVEGAVRIPGSLESSGSSTQATLLDAVGPPARDRPGTAKARLHLPLGCLAPRSNARSRPITRSTSRTCGGLRARIDGPRAALAPLRSWRPARRWAASHRALGAPGIRHAASTLRLRR